MLDRTRSESRVVIVGAGMAGLAAALRLSGEGLAVTLLERQERPGGKARAIDVGGTPIDSGPTVLTMKWVFDDLLAETGTTLSELVTLKKANVIARHGWRDGSRFDLFAEAEETIDAVAAFAGKADAEGYRRFSRDSRAVFETLKQTYIAAERPSSVDLARRIGVRNLSSMLALRPFTTLARALAEYFSDRRLIQLFARYATYCGSSPYLCPATLMLIAHVEQDGVWLVDGGMHRLAAALASLAAHRGVDIRYGATVARIETDHEGVRSVRLETGEDFAADAVIFNGDASALAGGMVGNLGTGNRPVAPSERSLSAMTFSMRAKSSGFPLAHHSVFFNDDYPAEFEAILKRRAMPDQPTVYICAQDRNADGSTISGETGDGESLFCLINAPANGDLKDYSHDEAARCLTTSLDHLRACGLTLMPAADPQSIRTTTPTDFASLYPGSGGALYGPAQHGWMASFSRPGARTKIPGLYLAGGSVHPGPGVPMSALSGRLAAESLITDRASTRTYRPAAISGGMSTG